MAELDVHSSLAFIAKEHGFIRPEMTMEPVYEIQGARHPVVERFQLLRGQNYVKNDCFMGQQERILFLTGEIFSLDHRSSRTKTLKF